MKNIFVPLVLILFLLSCSRNHKIVNKSEEDSFILSYKTCVLYYCINESTNGNFTDFCKKNNDLRLSAVALYSLNQEELELKGKELAKNVRTINYADYEGRKPLFSDCVKFAFSHEIDSLAKIEFKKMKK